MAGDDSEGAVSEVGSRAGTSAIEGMRSEISFREMREREQSLDIRLVSVSRDRIHNALDHGDHHSGLLRSRT